MSNALERQRTDAPASPNPKRRGKALPLDTEMGRQSGAVATVRRSPLPSAGEIDAEIERKLLEWDARPKSEGGR